MKKLKVRLTFTEPVLGTWPSNQKSEAMAKQRIPSFCKGIAPNRGGMLCNGVA